MLTLKPGNLMAPKHQKTRAKDYLPFCLCLLVLYLARVRVKTDRLLLSDTDGKTTSCFLSSLCFTKYRRQMKTRRKEKTARLDKLTEAVYTLSIVGSLAFIAAGKLAV
ncbi:hypothetical protein ES705_47605 [subsurface metagenome]